MTTPRPIRLEISGHLEDSALTARIAAAEKFLGIRLSGLQERKVYKVLPQQQAGDIQPQLAAVFADPVLQHIHFSPANDTTKSTAAYVAEISFRPGVTDNPARAAEDALAQAGIAATVASSSLFFMSGNISAEDARRIAEELLANSLIQKIDVYPHGDFLKLPRFDDVRLPSVRLGAAHAGFDVISLEKPDEELAALSRERCLALSLPELHHIRDYYRDATAARAEKGLPPDATDVELEILAQSWSEHCKHKIFAARVDYTGPDGATRQIDSLYKTCIRAATADIRKDRGIDWLVSVFTDNAGIVRFDDAIDLCIKVETHNSPSALDPYGGALTGILGVNRDILGAGMGARPVANTDVFCFAPPGMPDAGEEKFMPRGPQPPRRVLEGVHRGVEDGGNKSGIPTVNGAFFFDRDYAGKPLVFVGTVGVMPHTLPDSRPAAGKYATPGDRIFMVGGAIGADGIHGATFSSLELGEDAPATAVQIGDPLTQKRVTDFLLEARDLGLYSAITDNGAGGLSSSVGEMAQMTNGAQIDLARCPVKYPGLKPWELMISESQERMTLAVPPAQAQDFANLAARRGVSASDIGAFTDSGLLDVAYDGKRVACLPLDFIHDSLPQMQLRAVWEGPQAQKPWSATTRLQADERPPAPDSIAKVLLALLQRPNITSKEKWVRAYDHEVQAATHVKPFCGLHDDGPSDSGVIWLHPHGGGKDNAVAIGCGLAPRLSPVDPRLMAQCAVDEALRNVVASGGDPDMCCLLDNFCWPDPVETPANPGGAYKMGQLVRTCEGLYDICHAYGAPLVSGKDSMKNDFRGKDGRGEQIHISVLPTLMVTAMAKTSPGLAPGSDFKHGGDIIYLLGGHSGGLAASEFAACFAVADAQAPTIDMTANIALYRHIHAALKQGLLQSLHDVSDGGLLVCIAESMVGGRLGAHINIDATMETLFNEAPGRFVASVKPEHAAAFEALTGNACTRIGEVTGAPQLGIGNETIALHDIVACWQKGF